MLQWALAYAEIGWPVFPIHNVTGDGCSCSSPGCKNIAKHPRTKNGHNDATTDPNQIRQWWEKWPAANIGIATGPNAGFWVLDVDDKHDGPANLRKWEKENGPLPETVTSLTGGGGAHYLFRYPGDFKISSRQNILTGVDVRGAGGYIVAPPSVHSSGAIYEWADECDPGSEMSALPEDTTLALGVVTPESEAVEVSNVLDKIPDDPEEKEKLFSALQILDVDDRDHWFKSGMALHATGWDEAFDLWCAWSMQSHKFNISDSRRVWNSFKNDAGGLGLGSIYKLANDIEPNWSDGQEIKFVVTPGSKADLVLNGNSPKDKINGPYPTNRNLNPEIKLEKTREIRYLINGVIPAKSLCYVNAPPKTKKSFLACAIAYCAATGVPFCGQEIGEIGIVLYVSSEGANMLNARLLALQEVYGAEVEGRVVPIKDVFKTDNRMDLNALKNAILYVQDALNDKVTMVVFDTLARTMSGKENDNDNMGVYVDSCNELQNEFGVTTLLVCHPSKMNEDEPRGAGALGGATDMGFNLKSKKGQLEGSLISYNAKELEPVDFHLQFGKIELETDAGTITTLALTGGYKTDEAEVSDETEPKDPKPYFSKVDRYVIEVVQAMPSPRLWLDIRPLIKDRALMDNPGLNDKTFRNNLSRTIAKVSQKALLTIRHDKDSGLIWDSIQHTV